MNIRKIKQRLDRRNGKWLRYATPRVRGGITYLENQHQMIMAFGSPCTNTPGYYEQQLDRTARVKAHIEDTGEVHEMVMTSPKVSFKEVDHCAIIPNFDPEQLIAMKAMAKHVAESENLLVHAECMHKGAFNQITAEEVKQAAQNFLDMQANQPVADFVTIKDFEVVDGNTLKASLVLRPGNDAEMEILEKIKSGNPNAYSMSATLKKG